MINGCILPCVASMLWFTLNQPQLMGKRHLQQHPTNALMLLCVGVTLFLSSNVIMEQTLGRAWLAGQAAQIQRAAVILTAIELCLLSAFIGCSRRRLSPSSHTGDSAAVTANGMSLMTVPSSAQVWPDQSQGPLR